MSKPLVQATGRRKRSVARVRFSPGTGNVTINGKDLKVYFPTAQQQAMAMAPIRLMEADEHYDLSVTLEGGGTTGQAGAMSLGLARGLVELDPEQRGELKAAGLLRRDPRKKESKKYGLKKARKASQYSKR